MGQFIALVSDYVIVSEITVYFGIPRNLVQSKVVQVDYSKNSKPNLSRVTRIVYLVYDALGYRMI